MHFLKPHYDTEGPFGLPMKDAQALALEAIIKTLPRPAEPKFVTLDKAPSGQKGSGLEIPMTSRPLAKRRATSRAPLR